MEIFKVIVVYKKQEYLRNKVIKGVAAVSSSHLLCLNSNNTSFFPSCFCSIRSTAMDIFHVL